MSRDTARDEDRLIRLSTAAEMLGVEERRLRRWVRDGKIRGANLNKLLGGTGRARNSVRVLRSDVLRLLDAAQQSADGI